MKSRPDKYGNKKPVQIETGEWWWNGCIIQDQRDFSRSLPPFVIWPDKPDRDILNDDLGNIKIAWTFNEAKEIAFDWGNTFQSTNTTKAYL